MNLYKKNRQTSVGTVGKSLVHANKEESMKLRNRMILTLLVMTITAVSAFSQTVIQVAAGTDVLAPAISGAAAGDIIELTTDGGIYLNSDQITLSQDITIRGADGLSVLPVLKYIGTSTGAYFFKGTGSAQIVLENLEFDGDGTAEGGAALAKYVARLDNGDSTATLSLTMDNTVAHDFNDKFIKPYPLCGISFITVTNSTFYNGAREGIVLYSGSSSDPAAYVAQATIQNCTFYNIEREAVKGQTNPNTNVLVDRVTVYACGNAQNKPMMYFRDMENVVVKNSIFANSTNADVGEEFVDMASSVSLFHNNAWFDIVNSDVGNGTVTDTINIDPQFADAANGDFSLPAGSTLLTFADDGGAIGDAMWAPAVVEPVTYYVAAGTDVIEPVLAAANSGDTIELTSDGGLYLNTAQLVIDKSITIQGSFSSAVRPVIKYVGTSTSAYMFKNTSSDAEIHLNYIEFDGDGTAEGGAAKAKYVVRLDNGDTLGTSSLYMDNCIAHDFNEKFIKPYANNGMSELSITNSMFYNGAREGIVLYTGSSSDPAAPIANVWIENCTFYDIEREAIKGQTYPGAVVRIENVTVVRCGNAQNKPMMYFRDMEDVVVKNSIFAQSTNADVGEEFVDMASSVSQFHHNAWYDIVNSDVGNGTVSDTINIDPQFETGVNGEFHLPVGSPLLTFGDDGDLIGDPRWAPTATTWLVAAGTDVLEPAIAAAAPGDIIELTTNGGLYLNTAQIVLDKNITIKGSDGLPDLPILKYTGTSTSAYFFKGVGSSRIVLENLECDGDGTAEGGAGLAKYLVRLDNGDTSATMSLIVDNVVAHDFNEKFIKPYASTGMSLLKVTNSTFYNGAREGIVLYTGSSSDPAVHIAQTEIQNCTFYAIEREAIKGQTYPDNNVLIDHITVYDVGNAQNKPMLYFRDMENVVVKNSIFVNSQNADAGEEFADFASSVSLFHHNVWFDIVNSDVGNATVSDTLNVDPMFADAAAGNFSIPEGSALLTFADDGSVVGDQNWGPSNGPFAITIITVGSGTVDLDPPGGVYDEGTVVTVTATPAEFFAFDHWSDNVLTFPPDNPVGTVTVDGNLAVTAYFVPTVEEFQVETATIGYGHIEEELYSDYGSLDGYFDGDSLVLTPVADSTNWEFAYWVDTMGDSVGNANPLSWIVSADTVFTAMFRSTLPQAAFNLTLEGMGGVAVDPLPVEGFNTYDVGTEITLAAEAALGWSFAGYSGDLTDANALVTFTIAGDMNVTATFTENSHPDGILAVPSSWDLLEAVEYAHNNSQVNTLVLTDIGPYQPSEEQRNPADGRMPQIDIYGDVAIMGADTLSAPPLVRGYTSSTGSTSSEGFFRFRGGHMTLKLKNLALDGYLDPASDASPAKYFFRADDGADTIWNSLDAEMVVFKNTVEAMYKNYARAMTDTIRFKDCMVSEIGKEGFLLKDVGHVNQVALVNSTFRHIAREILYLRGIPEATVNIDHVTIADCGYGVGGEGDKFGAVKIENTTNVQIHNLIVENVTNTVYGYALRFAGAESEINHALFHNSPMNIDNRDDATIGGDVFWYDPMFVDGPAGDYTLADSSVAYHLAGDDSPAIGDLRWATSTSIASYAALYLSDNGYGWAEANPAPMARFYVPGTDVTLQAWADTLYKFGQWTGDFTGSDNPATVSMDADKHIVAEFIPAFWTVTMNVDMSYRTFIGGFDPAVDSVDMAGNMNEWGAIPMWLEDADGDTIYTHTIIVDENYPDLEWKFRINGSWSDDTAEFPYGGPNRTYTVTGDVELDFWYNDEDFTTGVRPVIPLEYSLEQNYPNPFNPSTTIEFALKEAGDTRLVVFDITGRTREVLVDRHMEPGYYQIDFSDPMLSSGVYFYRLVSGDFMSVRKMLLVK